MAKKRRIIIAILFCCYATFAQQTTLNSIKSQLDAMFVGLDKTKVPTGSLWDTAVNLVEGEQYNGSALTDSNFVSLTVMGDMLYDNYVLHGDTFGRVQFFLNDEGGPFQRVNVLYSRESNNGPGPLPGNP